MVQIFQSRGSLPHALYQVDSSMQPATFPFGYNPQQMPQLHNGISTASETQFLVNPLNGSMHRTPTSIQLPTIDGFAEAAPQVNTKENLGLLIHYNLNEFPLHNLKLVQMLISRFLHSLRMTSKVWSRWVLVRFSSKAFKVEKNLMEN